MFVKTLAFIWDLDGTLLDSYGVIVNSLYQIYKEKGIEIDKQEILRDVINESVSYFDDIVTSLDGFERKPSPDGINYLIEKHHLDKEKTFYVGDRPMDILCAANAHIKSIMFVPDNSVARSTGKETYIIKDLLDIIKIVEKENK